MNDTATPVNRHPVDQLADLRETMKGLKDFEDDLKAQVSALMGSADSLGGDQYIARQTVSQRAGGIDAEAMKRAGIDVEKFRKPNVTVYSIRCERREQEAM